MTKIIENETFTINTDGTLRVTKLTEFTESIEEPYIIYREVTEIDKYVNRESYKAQKENIKWEGKIEMARGLERVEEAEKILRELERTEPPK
jgi:hypothetical protein